jgi:protease I
MPDISGKKMLVILPSGRFNDTEFDKTCKILTRYGAIVTVCCPVKRAVYGLLRSIAKPDLTNEEVKLNEFDGIVFIGGIGSKDYWDNPWAHKIVQDCAVQNKVLAATSLAVITLARAGVLKGKKATCFFGEKLEISKYGGEYTSASVTIDGLIITGKGPETVDDFGLKLVMLLSELKG